MEFDTARMPPQSTYKLLTSLVVPRPIAWITTVDAAGAVNAAPFSFFNAIGADPPLVVIGVGDRAPGVPKDTAANIAATREFVVNFVTEAAIDAMNVCAADLPAGVDELRTAGLSPVPSRMVRPPRIAESPAHLECREHTTLHIGKNHVIIGQVVAIHLRDDLFDADTFRVKTADIHLVGRMGGTSAYVRTRDRFELARLTAAELTRRA